MPYADPQKRKECHARWRAANREKCRARSRAWNQSENGKMLKAEWHRDNYVPSPRVLLDPEEARRRRLERHYAWVKANPGKLAEAKRRWRQMNIEHVREYEEAYRAANAEPRAKNNARWMRENASSVRVRNQNRRARRMAAEGFHTPEDVARITKMQKGRCACCGKKRKLTIDHIVPLTKGGSNWPCNIQMLCQPCNSGKKDKDPIEHRQRLGMLI